MNILFHMLLSGHDEQLMVGNFMGDFVKGPLDDTYPVPIRNGLLLHRKIDCFAQGNSSFQTSRLRISPRFGLYRGVLVDLYYDHFLALGWQQWSLVDFDEYLAASRKVLDRYLPLMPPRLQEFMPIIFNDLLPSYATISGIDAALKRMSRRVRRDNPLGSGTNELVLHYNELKSDFESFMVEVQQFTNEYINRENHV